MNRIFAIALFCFLGNYPSSKADDSIRMNLDAFGGGIAIREDAKPYPRLAGEFEPTQVLLFGVSDWQPIHRKILIEIAKKTAGHVNVLILCNDTWQIKETTQWLLEESDTYDNIYFREIELDTVWLRDFGPIFSQTQAGAQTLDFYYEGTRPKDDELPRLWSRLTGTKYVKVPWTIQGGNLICNGQGTALVTNRVFQDNFITFPSPPIGQNPEVERRKMVVDELVKFGNLSQLVVLEPLESESTKHVDMFATFLSPVDVLVARLNPATDPINAAILDRNAERLRSIRVGDHPMRVHRVEIPARQGTSWSAYTNAIIATDLVLVPVFRSDPPALIAAAVATYQRLLPTHSVETIDMTSMKELQGELHCLSLHVPAFAAVPDNIYPFKNSVRAYFPKNAQTP